MINHPWSANYVVSVDGTFSLVFGTSCSAPVVGSIITLVNDARIAAGKAPVGFLNPTVIIYIYIARTWSHSTLITDPSFMTTPLHQCSMILPQGETRVAERLGSLQQKDGIQVCIILLSHYIMIEKFYPVTGFVQFFHITWFYFLT